MLQSPTRRVRYNERQLPEGQRFLDPAKIERRFYGMILTGTGLDPVFKDGETVVFDREAPLENGCFANFFYRPELVPPGQLGVGLKLLLVAPPPFVTFPWNDHPESTVLPVMIVQQLNPPEQWSIRCDMLLAVRRCIGLKDSPEVDAYIMREWRP
jgi:hypothetical protein